MVVCQQIYIVHRIILQDTWYATQTALQRNGKNLSLCAYRSRLTASAIIASTTTSAMAEPRFWTVKKVMRFHLELLNVAFRPRISHGTRESTVAITKYGTLFLPFIGIQSDTILHIRHAIRFQRTNKKLLTQKRQLQCLDYKHWRHAIGIIAILFTFL